MGKATAGGLVETKGGVWSRSVAWARACKA